MFLTIKLPGNILVKTATTLRQTDNHTELLSTLPEAPVTHENAILTRFVATRRNYLFFKRIVDIIVALLFIVLVLSWLLPIVAIWIVLDSKGPVFFSQKRIGRNGRSFQCFKLRTMIRNDEADEKQAEEDDHRITRCGKFLRRTNIDELPQFFNILGGSMSLIGPRPHMVADCMRFSFVISSYNFRNLLKPGLTGLAQIKGYRGPTKDYESVINRYKWDAVYIRRAGVWLDVKIIGNTILRCIKNLAVVSFSVIKKES
jgi:putative colanic acid biosynthesis UDP-glucose lipid carrier transferase